jgi:eukaryotic-like serine/threonine-protein kinase
MAISKKMKQGTSILHYTILDKLGEGGMGVVYKAHDNRLDRTVALKFLPAHISRSEPEKKRFLHEARAASALDHPTSVPYMRSVNHPAVSFLS